MMPADGLLQKVFQDSHDLLDFTRFVKKIIRAVTQASLAVLWRREIRQHDDLWRLPGILDILDQIHPAAFRHTQVDDRDIRFE